MTTRRLLSAALIVCVCSLVVSGCGPPGAANSESKDQASISRILAGRIRAGDSLADVEAQLGAGKKLTTDESAVAAAAVLRWQNDQPDYYADGVEDRDFFMRWPIADGCTLQLQFRDDRLINHIPESYVHNSSE